MTVANQDRTIEVGGKTYAIRFTQNALYRLMREARAQGGAFLSGVGLVEIQLMMWAGLEGARLKSRSRPEPFTLDEAGDIIDEIGLERASEIVIDAFRAAQPRSSLSPLPDRVEGEGEGRDPLAHNPRSEAAEKRDGTR